MIKSERGLFAAVFFPDKNCFEKSQKKFTNIISSYHVTKIRRINFDYHLYLVKLMPQL